MQESDRTSEEGQLEEEGEDGEDKMEKVRLGPFLFPPE